MRQAQHQQWYEFGLSAIDAAFQPSQQDKPLWPGYISAPLWNDLHCMAWVTSSRDADE